MQELRSTDYYTFLEKLQRDDFSPHSVIAERKLGYSRWDFFAELFFYKHLLSFYSLENPQETFRLKLSTSFHYYINKKSFFEFIHGIIGLSDVGFDLLKISENSFSTGKSIFVHYLESNLSFLLGTCCIGGVIFNDLDLFFTLKRRISSRFFKSLQAGRIGLLHMKE